MISSQVYGVTLWRSRCLPWN